MEESFPCPSFCFSSDAPQLLDVLSKQKVEYLCSCCICFFLGLTNTSIHIFFELILGREIRQ